MNAKTPEQRREICDMLYRVWEGAIEEAGEHSLSDLLRIGNTSDTAIIQHIADCYFVDIPEFETFEGQPEREKYPFVRPAWDIIAETYKMNPADRQQVRRILEDYDDKRALVLALQRLLGTYSK